MMMTFASTINSTPSEKSSSFCPQETNLPSHFSFESSHPKTHSIPISNGLLRTASEIQLCVDEALAEQRDRVFYSRLVNGIRQTQGLSQNRQIRIENQVCLNHIMQTRLDRQTDQESWFFGLSTKPPSTDEESKEEEGIFELDL